MLVIAASLCVSLLLPGSPGADPTGRWPVPGAEGGPRPTVARAFQPPAEPWGAGHRGVDLHTAPGAPVRAAAPGVVTFAGQVAGRGVVTLELDGSGSPPLRLTHEPVRPAVAAGQRVRAGEVLGELAAEPSHCAACLHWGLLRGETYLDPLSLLPPRLLRSGPVRLLPTAGVPLPEAGRGQPTDTARDTGGAAPGVDRPTRPGPPDGRTDSRPGDAGPAGHRQRTPPSGRPAAPAGRRGTGATPGRSPAGAGGRPRRRCGCRGALSHGRRRAWPAIAGRTWCGSG